MALFDIYSKRQKRLRGEVNEIYVYDSLPYELRVQFIHVLDEMLGGEDLFISQRFQTYEIYKTIVNVLRREYGVFCLVDRNRINYRTEVKEFLLTEKDIEKCMDVIEIACRIADSHGRKYEHVGVMKADEHIDSCLSEINGRFKEHAVGYQYVEGFVVRNDSDLLHKEIVVPAVKLLNRVGFEGPQDEFLNAYEHYRKGNKKEALNDALKSLESTFKVIFEKCSWEYDARDTAKDLISKSIKNKLIPEYYQNHISALKNLLESSVPTIRNKLGGHGQGSSVLNIDDHVAAYTLHMTAAAIVMLVECEHRINKN